MLLSLWLYCHDNILWQFSLACIILSGKVEHLRELYSWYQGNYFSDICVAVPAHTCWKFFFLSCSVIWTWQQKCVASDFICLLSINERGRIKAPRLNMLWSAVTSVHSLQHLPGLPSSCWDALLQMTGQLTLSSCAAQDIPDPVLSKCW